MSLMKFSTKYNVSRLTNADQPNSPVRLCNRNFCVSSTGCDLICAGATENAMHRLCPRLHVVPFEKASILVPAKSNGRNMACLIQHSLQHSTLGPTANCSTLKSDRIQRFEALLDPYSSLIKTPWPMPIVVATSRHPTKPVRDGFRLAAPLYVAVPDVVQSNAVVSFQVSAGW